MPYFFNLQSKLFHSSKLSIEEMIKPDKFLLLLEESGVGKIIEEATKTDINAIAMCLKEDYYFGLG